MLLCRECGVERDELYFVLTKGKWYFTKRCKVCLGYKNIGSKGKYIKRDPDTKVALKLEKQPQLSKDVKVFLNHLKMRNGYVNMIDAFKLAHYFIETFGYIDIDDMEIKDQLIFMYDKLLKAENGYSTS